MAALLKSLTLRKPICGMGKSFYGIWSEEVRQTVEKTIAEEMGKIVQLPDKVKYQMHNENLAILQAKLENLELKAENLALKENVEQKANCQAIKAEMMNQLKDEFAKMLSTQNEQHQQQIAQSESKYRKLMERLSAVQLQTKEMTTNGVSEKQLRNPAGNRFKEPNPIVTISRDGLKLENTWQPHVYAEKGFDISGDSRQRDNFNGTIIYYFEAKQTTYGGFQIGLSDGSIPAYGKHVGDCPNSYGLPNYYYCWISGNIHVFEWPEGVTKPEPYIPRPGDVDGCGLLLSPDNKLAIFFTLDGILLGKPIPIKPVIHGLYPTVTIGKNTSLEANFGDDPAKPFSFDITKCPRLVFP